MWLSPEIRFFIDVIPFKMLKSNDFLACFEDLFCEAGASSGELDLLVKLRKYISLQVPRRLIAEAANMILCL